jgi:hypothetical protein
LALAGIQEDKELYCHMEYIWRKCKTESDWLCIELKGLIRRQKAENIHRKAFSCNNGCPAKEKRIGQRLM